MDFNSSDDEDSISPELEAELYSKIHYGDNSEDDYGDVSKNDVKAEYNQTFLNTETILVDNPEISENVSLDVLKEILDSKPNSPSENKYDDKNDDIQKCIELNSSVSSSESEDDSGIQIIKETNRKKESRKNHPLVLNLATSESSDSEIEHLPGSLLKKRSAPQELVIELEKETPLKKSRKNTSFLHQKQQQNKKSKFVIQNSSNSSDDVSEDEAVDVKNLSLNLKGGWNNTDDSERTFAQVIGDNFIQTSVQHAENTSIPPKKWTKKMDEYYNMVDPKLADIDIDQIMDELPSDRKFWLVRKPHSTPSRRAAARYFHGKKCLNCNREGHLAKSCPEPKRNPVCFMCMEEGHSHSSCPNQHCLRCGKSGEPYSENCRKCRYLDTMDCRLCGGRGHIQSRCPDTWRRYHATTTPNIGIVQPAQDQHIPVWKCYCCNCGRQGHYVHQCRGYSYSKIPPFVLNVISYKNSQREGDFQNSSTPTTTTYESKSERKRRLREELRTKKREYLSLPSTPTRIDHNFEETKQTLIKAKKSLDNAVNKKKKKKIKRSKYNNPEELSINEELESTKPWYEKVKRKLKKRKSNYFEDKKATRKQLKGLMRKIKRTGFVSDLMQNKVNGLLSTL